MHCEMARMLNRCSSESLSIASLVDRTLHFSSVYVSYSTAITAHHENRTNLKNHKEETGVRQLG